MTDLRLRNVQAGFCALVAAFSFWGSHAVLDGFGMDLTWPMIGMAMSLWGCLGMGVIRRRVEQQGRT